MSRVILAAVVILAGFAFWGLHQEMTALTRASVSAGQSIKMGMGEITSHLVDIHTKVNRIHQRTAPKPKPPMTIVPR